MPSKQRIGFTTTQRTVHDFLINTVPLPICKEKSLQELLKYHRGEITREACVEFIVYNMRTVIPLMIDKRHNYYFDPDFMLSEWFICINRALDNFKPDKGDILIWCYTTLRGQLQHKYRREHTEGYRRPEYTMEDYKIDRQVYLNTKVSPSLEFTYDIEYF